MARYIILSSGGSLSYTTPQTVDKLRDRHEKLLNAVKEAIKTALHPRRITPVEIEPSKTCLTVTVAESCYSICGVPDAVYLLFSDEFYSPVLLVVEATLSPSTVHAVNGEMLFYTLAAYISHGCRVFGLLVNPEQVHLIAYALNAAEQVKHLLTPPSYDKALEKAEGLRARKKWMCSLCDLKHLCQLGTEI